MSQAAGFERRGQAVPESVMQSLQDTRAELVIAEELMQIRKDEYQEVIDKYDEDIANFAKGEALEKLSKAKIE